MRLLAGSLFVLLILSAPVLAQPSRLTPGQLATINFPEVTDPTLFSGSDGFFVEVPADAVRLVVSLTTSPPEANIDLYVRLGEDPEIGPGGDVVADYRSEGPTGAEQIVVDLLSVPPISEGRYFIATRAGFRTPMSFGFLIANVELSAGDPRLVVISSSDFEAGEDGWTTNFPEPDPVIPGSSLGGEDSTLDVFRIFGPPSNRVLLLTSQGEDFFVAPTKFLGNWALLGANLRLEFDLRYNGPVPPDNSVEVRILGERSGFAWTGNAPRNRLESYSVSLDSLSWVRIAGQATMEELLTNVQRFEIRGKFGPPGNETWLDNVRLLGQVNAPRAPLVSSFDSGEEGWKRNRFDAPFLIPRVFGVTQGDNATQLIRPATGGNPGPYLRITEFGGGARDYMVAPPIYLGNLAQLGPEARLEVDRFTESGLGADRQMEIRLIGFGGAYRYNAPPPGEDWTHYSAELDPDVWSRIAGDLSFEETLRAVQRIEVSVDDANGPEIAGFDNFALLAPSAGGPSLSVDPVELYYVFVEGEGVPRPQTVSITSTDPAVPWTASSSADWILLSQSEGTTPTNLVIEANPAGLNRGIHEAAVAIARQGSADTPLLMRVRLTILPPTAPLISRGGVVNAADFTPNADSGGELTGGIFAAVFGIRMSTRRALVSSVPFPETLGGASVTVDGIPAPMVFASDPSVPFPQLVFVVPQAVAGPTAEVVVTRGGEVSAAEHVRIGAVRPVIFSQDQTGTGPGAIQNVKPDGSVEINTPQTPGRPRQPVTVFFSGGGPTEIPVADGDAAEGINPISGDVEVMIGGVTHTPIFAGLSPQSPHLYQANVVLRDDAPLGCEIDIQIVIDGVESNIVTLAITLLGERCEP